MVDLFRSKWSKWSKFKNGEKKIVFAEMIRADLREMPDRLDRVVRLHL